MVRLDSTLVLAACISVVGACGTPAANPPVTVVDMTVPGTCSDDSQCVAPTPRCNKNSSKCVPCLPDNDNCPKGQRCIASNGSFTCSSSCVVDADCPRSDGGNPMSCCTGACVDTSSDTQSCGKCGTACFAPTNATPGCMAGMCGVGTCNLGFLDCDRGASNGCEVDANTDGRNCGACGKVCTAGANQMAACTNGLCTTACSPGYADCDANPANGCEVTTQTDGKNCGACGTTCALANASSLCKGGACVIDSCNPGFDDCNQSAKDGCEADLKQDVTHCGNCMNACMAQNGAPACRSGSCGIASCNVGFADCDSLVLNGCEVSTVADPKNCGACGRMCTGANSVQACQMGACAITSCAQGFSDCDKMQANGCEVNVAADTMNCGGCGNACPVPANATASCVNAQCGVGQCKFGFSDCNKNANDGCEVDLQTIQNCGQCGNVCAAPANATAGCKAGLCGIGMCNNLFGDCDGNAGNGCEKNLAADTMNCGKCGTVCTFAHAQGACLGGQCGIFQCNQGFGDCDMNGANGCEADFATDAKNCNGCGKACPQGQACANGMCAASIHNTIVFQPQRNAANTCAFNGSGALRYTELGQMTWKQCVVEASKRSAMLAATEYTNKNGWYSHRNGNNAMTGVWPLYRSQDINTPFMCVVGWDPAISPDPLKTLSDVISYDGQVWHYQDFGVKFYDECQSLATQYGSTIITPWTIGLNKDNYFVQSVHQCNTYEWITNNGTAFNNDNVGANARSTQHLCMVGYVDN